MSDRDTAFAAAAETARRVFEAQKRSGSLDPIHPRRGWERAFRMAEELAEVFFACWIDDAVEGKEGLAARLVENAGKRPDSFHKARLVAAKMVAHGVEMPEPLRGFAAEVLAGRRRPPQRRGDAIDVIAARDRLLFALLNTLRRDFGPAGLALNRRTGEPAVSLCDAVVEGWKSAGLPGAGFGSLNYATVRAAWKTRGL